LKYAKKIPPADPELRGSLLDEGWEKIKEAPNLFFAFLLSIPFMIINASISYLILFLVNPSYTQMVNDFLFSGSWSFTIRFDYVIYVYLFIISHEIIHLLFIPNFYRSEKTYFGIKPWGGFVFTTACRLIKRFSGIFNLSKCLLIISRYVKCCFNSNPGAEWQHDSK